MLETAGLHKKGPTPLMNPINLLFGSPCVRCEFSEAIAYGLEIGDELCLPRLRHGKEDSQTAEHTHQKGKKLQT